MSDILYQSVYAFHGLEIVWWLWRNGVRQDLVIFGPVDLSVVLKNFWSSAFKIKGYMIYLWSEKKCFS